MGGPNINYPEPSAEERQLQTKQIESLEQQNTMLREAYERQRQLEPLFWEASGLEAERDEQGNITGFKKKAPTETEQAAERILNLQLQKTEAGLKGELPLNPAMIRDLQEQQAEMEAELAAQFGPGWQTASPAIERMAEFNKRREELFDASRRGDISMFEGMSLARQGQMDERLNQALSRYSMVPGRQQAAALTFGQAAAGYSDPLARYQKDRQNAMTADYYSAAAPSFAQRWLAPIGTTFGQAAGGAAALWAACWIAAALYGPDSPQFHLARFWINYGWQGRLATATRWLYRRFGLRVASWAVRFPALRAVLRPLFDVAVRRGAVRLLGA